MQRRQNGLSIGLVALLGWCAATTTSAQPVPTIQGERVDVRLVEVELWATTKDGRPVRDLLQSELQLYSDGEPADIGFFTPPAPAGAPERRIAQSEAAPRASEAAVSGGRGTIAVFIDDAHLAPANRARVIDALVEWLEQRFDDRTALTVARYAYSIDVVAPRNAPREEVVAALRGIANGGGRAIQEANEERRTLDEIRERQRRGLAAFQQIHDRFDVEGGGRLGGPAGGERELPATDLPCSTEMLRMAEDLASQVERTARDSIAALASYASSLAAAPGRKLLLYVGDGIPQRPGGAAYDLVRTLCDGSGAMQGIDGAIDVSAQPGELRQRPGQLDRTSLAMAGESRQLANPFAALAAQASAEGITIWTLGARGLTTGGLDATTMTRDRTGSDELRQRADLEAALTSLAADTGGRALLDLGDFGDGLDDLSEDLGSSYLLAFLAPRIADGKLHPIRVETTRNGVRLRYRRMWRDTSGEAELGELVAAALLHGIDRPGLHASARAVRLGEAAGGPRTVLRVVVPEDALALISEEGGGRHGVLRLAIAVREPGGDPSPVRSRTFPIERPTGGEAGRPQAVVHEVELPPLAVGSTVAVGIRDEIDGDLGILRVEVKDS